MEPLLLTLRAKGATAPRPTHRTVQHRRCRLQRCWAAQPSTSVQSKASVPNVTAADVAAPVQAPGGPPMEQTKAPTTVAPDTPQRSAAPAPAVTASSASAPGSATAAATASKPATPAKQATSQGETAAKEAAPAAPTKAAPTAAAASGPQPATTAAEPKTDAPAQMNVAVQKNTAAVVRDIVFVTSEVAPYSKTGGLGDVCGSLPKALAARGHRVMVVAPLYQDYPGVSYSGVNGQCDDQTVGYHTASVDSVDFVFVDHPSYKRPGGLYGDAYGTYGDNQWRFKLLCIAALEAPLKLALGERGIYGQECIFVANDWFAGLVPVYLAARYRPYGVYLGARSILAIHNLRHQGVFPPATFATLGLPPSWYGCMEWQYPPHLRQGAYEEEGRAVNTMKAAISTADRIVTVSPGYAYEIQTALGGWGMEFLLGGRQYALNGILNGIDDNEWNPEKDKTLPYNYSLEDLSGKAKCKAELQRELGLPVRDDVPLIAFIGRLDYQKGADQILAAAPWMMSHGVQLVCLGTGDMGLEDGLRWLEQEYPSQARGWVGFNVPFSHRLTAGADILLMPSRFEPCGLNQLYAMRYGTVPVAHATGGLRDTVINFDANKPDGTTGFVFSPCDENALKDATWKALTLYWNNKEAWRGLVERGMRRNCTWDKAAEQYEQIFTWAKTDLPYCG